MFLNLVPAGLVTGVPAELALALPFGALSALLLDTGIRSTRRVALSAATGVALADIAFAALSAANPPTTITLTAMAAGLGANVGLAAAAWFVTGCGVVSMGWHSILAAGGQLVGTKLGGCARSVASHLGAGVTILMAVLMALPA